MAKPMIIVYDNTTREDIDDLNDVVVTSVADNEVLAYDSATSKWINQTASEAGLSTPSDLTTEIETYLSNIIINLGEVITNEGEIVWQI